MAVARLCAAAAAARLQPALAAGARGLGTAAEVAAGARWEPMGAREYYDYRRAMYGDITHKAILVDAAGTLLAPTEPMAQVRTARPSPRPRHPPIAARARLRFASSSAAPCPAGCMRGPEVSASHHSWPPEAVVGFGSAVRCSVAV
jgi:hypothetical protein